MNKHVECIFVIPEDDADRQIADGFVLHPSVKDVRIQVLPPAGGWSKVLKTLRDEYIPVLRAYPKTHVVMLIDFDDQVEERKDRFEQAIPDDLKARVFVVGSRSTPEMLKNSLRFDFEKIGKALANDCDADALEYWGHEQLRHNDAEPQRLVQTVKPFLF